MCFGKSPPFWHRPARLGAGSGSAVRLDRTPHAPSRGRASPPGDGPVGRRNGVPHCRLLPRQTPLLASFNRGTGRHDRSRDAVVLRAQQRAPGRAEPRGRNSRGGADGANARRGSGAAALPARPRSASGPGTRCCWKSRAGAAPAWGLPVRGTAVPSRLRPAARWERGPPGEAHGTGCCGRGSACSLSPVRVPPGWECGLCGRRPRSVRPSPRAGGRAWRAGSPAGRGGAVPGRGRSRAVPSAPSAPLSPFSPRRSAVPGAASRDAAEARPGPARLAMVPRPALPVLAHSVLAALLLSAAQEPVPRVSLPYGECPP